jgi:hypothetical protein
MKRILMGEGESVEARPLTRSSALIGRDALSREGSERQLSYQLFYRDIN